MRPADLDLRGNTGGGIGCLRVMSHLCGDRRGVGYSVTREMMKNGFDETRLPAFDRIPSSKLGVFPLVFRFVLPCRRSVAVFTERLGHQPHHGRIVILVNEYAASAAEMVAGFAAGNGLATLVGTGTAGRLVASSAFKVGEGTASCFLRRPSSPGPEPISKAVVSSRHTAKPSVWMLSGRDTISDCPRPISVVGYGECRDDVDELSRFALTTRRFG